eukprot:2286765-Rhodomonas_salina.2
MDDGSHGRACGNLRVDQRFVSILFGACKHLYGICRFVHPFLHKFPPCIRYRPQRRLGLMIYKGVKAFASA